MKAIPWIHLNQRRIRVLFGYDSKKISLLKTFDDCRWSRTGNCWHIPMSKENAVKLKKMFADIEFDEIINSLIGMQKTEKTVDKATVLKEPEKNKEDVKIYADKEHIYISLKKDDTDIAFIRAMKYSKWVSPKQYWQITNSERNLALIKKYFSERFDSIIQINNMTDKETLKAKEQQVVEVVRYNEGRIRVISPYVKVLIAYLKQLPYSRWDNINKWWSLPFNEMIVDKIQQISESKNMNFVYNTYLAGKPEEKHEKRHLTKHRKCPDQMKEKLKIKRYSENTVKLYCEAFEGFINYFYTKDIDKLNETDVKQYFRYLIEKCNISESYQNTVVNAIKFYYEKVLGGERRTYYIDRPRREKTLPKVISTEEVGRIINSITNLKHKCIVMMLYSTGIRMGELLNLQIEDIDSKRQQIRINSGKGRKDRYTLLSQKMLGLLRTYYKMYKPKHYLFEGAEGGSYSSRSVNNIIKGACVKAKTRTNISAHTLRHSFATHLLEQGTDLRYIQSLLGHNNSKTTEIYTHITNKGIEKIKNPLDSLKI